MTVPEIRKAAAAAILTTAELTEQQRTKVADASQKFSVHPHIAEVNPADPLLTGYLSKIYGGREHRDLLIALVEEEPTHRAVTPANSEGGLDLLKWVTATDDANRRESLRHDLTLTAASATATVPNATTVRKLAERQRIALTREHAAEVQRAITEGQRDTSAALRHASEELGRLLEETSRVAGATIVGVIGLVAFLARDADRLPDWLVGLATLVAVIGIGVVVRSYWSRVSDQEIAVQQLWDRLCSDPLVPDDDKKAVKDVIDAFGLQRRARSARRTIAGLAIAACLVAVAAAAWLVLHTPPTDPAHWSTLRVSVAVRLPVHPW